MGFKSVYRTLQELFPQVDIRLLKAAAIEHPKDPDGAVDFILKEVLPYTTKQFETSSSITESLGYPSSVENETHCETELLASTCASSSKHASTSLVAEAANGSREMNEPNHVETACLNETVHGSLDSTSCDAKDIGDELSGSTEEAGNASTEINKLCHVDPACSNETVHGSLESTFSNAKDIVHQLSGNSGTVELKASRACEETAAEAVQDVPFQNISVFHTSEEVYGGDPNQKPENNCLEDTTALQKYRDLDLPDVSYSLSSSSNVLEDAVPDVTLNNRQHVDSQRERSSFDSDSLYGSNYVELASLSVKDQMMKCLDCSIQSEVQSDMSASDLEIPGHNGLVDGASRDDIQVPDCINIEESSSVHTVLTRSGQFCSTGLLEDIIEDSKSHKKTLFSTMESVLKLMREVELQEKVAQQAKEEALKGGLEVLARVDELKRMLNHAREANDMHSGEVYGERAILATEMRELQSRLLALSDEKDNSLSILHAMRQALETRLAAAEAERIAAEREKLEKEESALKALAEQELIMEKVVQESKMLQHEAEENAKLREFLVDRGRVVDMLQGEISVICQDVKLLKEKLDSHVPLSQCLSSKQTSCILASSGSSSMKSTGSEKGLEQANWSTSSDEPILLPSLEQATVYDHKELVEEGWELFDNAA